MKGSSLIISVILSVAVIVLYILHFTSKNGEESESMPQKVVASTDGLKIAYVKADSIILNYNLAQDLHDEFTKKQEAYTTEYGSKRQTFEKEAVAFQEKVQRGGFLTEQRAIQERDRLAGKEQEILKLDQDLSSKLSELQSKNTRQVLDSLMSYLKEYNKGDRYDYIFNGTNILIGEDANNLTSEVLSALNQRYSGK